MNLNLRRVVLALVVLALLSAAFLVKRQFDIDMQRARTHAA